MSEFTKIRAILDWTIFVEISCLEQSVRCRDSSWPLAVPVTKNWVLRKAHKELANLSYRAFQSSLLCCVWALTSKRDWIEILLTGQVLYGRLRLVMSHQAVSLPQRLHYGRLMKAFFRTPVVGAPAWLWLRGVWRCTEACNRVHQTSNSVLQMEIIQPYLLKAE